PVNGKVPVPFVVLPPSTLPTGVPALPPYPFKIVEPPANAELVTASATKLIVVIVSVLIPSSPLLKRPKRQNPRDNSTSAAASVHDRQPPYPTSTLPSPPPTRASVMSYDTPL